MKRSFIVLSGVGIVALAVIGMLANAQGQGQGNSGRHITLLPQAGAPYDIARGTLTITPLQHFQRFFDYTVHNLRRQHGSNAFAIYVSTPSTDRFRVRTFNTSGGEGHTTHWTDIGLVPNAEDPLWETETITVEVYLEADDGRDAPDVGGLLVLRGVDPGD